MRSLPFWAFLVLTLAACTAAPREGWVAGTLGLGPGGPSVGGAWVYWEGPRGAWAARTDDQGRFSLLLPPGPYRVWVEGAGLAASRVEGLEVVPGVQAVRLGALPPFRASWPRVAPRVWGEVREVAGGWVRFRGGMEAAEGLAPLALLAGVGQVPTSLSAGPVARFYLEEAEDTGVRALAVFGLGGRTQLVLVGYDINNNRTELHLPLDLPQDGGMGVPQAFRAVAFTLARPLSALAQEASGSFFVRLSWRGGGDGPLTLWRREREGWTLVARLPPGVEAYLDLGPGFHPGEQVCYWLEGGAGGASACTTFLPLLTLEVLRPQPGEVLPSRPEFRWRVLGAEGVRLFFRPAVWDQLTGGGVFLGLTSEDRATPSSPLVPGRLYAFELYQAYGVDDPADPRAYTILADRQGLLSGFSLAGPAVSFRVEEP